MPINGFSVGRDLTVNIITATGPMNPGLITKFGSKPLMTDQKIKGMDGKTRHLRFPDGWEGHIDIERRDSTLDDYWAQLEANYYSGINEQPCTILETKQEPNGAVTQYRYVGVYLKLDDAGDSEGDKSVKQKLSFVAEQRVKVA